MQTLTVLMATQLKHLSQLDECVISEATEPGQYLMYVRPSRHPDLIGIISQRGERRYFKSLQTAWDTAKQIGFDKVSLFHQ